MDKPPPISKNPIRMPKKQPSPQILTVAISDLVLNKGTQMRASLDQKWLTELTEKLVANKDRKPEDQEKLDPIGVVRDAEGHLYVWDGFHRINAHKNAKLKEVDAEVVEGDLSTAKRLAYGANAKHGVKRSRADIKFIAEKILKDKDIMESNPSNMELARITGISEFTFRKMRPVQAGEAPRTSTSKTGKKREVSTKNIGKKTGAQAPTKAEKAKAAKAEKTASTTSSKTASAKSGSDGAPKTPTIDDLDADLQRAVRKLSNTIGGKAGEELRDALVLNTLNLTRRDIMDFANTSEERIKKLYPLVVEYRMKPGVAIRVIDNPVDAKSKVGDLILAQVAAGGWLEEKIEGESDLVILVINTKLHQKPVRPIGKKAAKVPAGPAETAAPETTVDTSESQAAPGEAAASDEVID